VGSPQVVIERQPTNRQKDTPKPAIGTNYPHMCTSVGIMCPHASSPFAEAMKLFQRQGGVMRMSEASDLASRENGCGYLRFRNKLGMDVALEALACGASVVEERSSSQVRPNHTLYAALAGVFEQKA
jgi:hypothetical protein